MSKESKQILPVSCCLLIFCLSAATALFSQVAFNARQDFKVLVGPAPGTAGIPDAIAAADFDGDGIIDLAVAVAAANRVAIFLGDGSNGFAYMNSFTVGTGPRALAVGDFNGDGIPDLAVANSGSANVSCLLGAGDGSFQLSATVALQANGNPRAVAVGDFNGDKVLDIVVANNNANSVSLLIGHGDGLFDAPRNTTGIQTNPRGIVVGDFDGDDNLDVITVNSGSNNASLLLGNGAGGFITPPRNTVVGTSPRAVVTGDFDGDDNLDVAVLNYVSKTISVLMGNGDGTFLPPRTIFLGQSFTDGAMALGDFDGDGIPDLAVANTGASNVRILFGDGTGRFQNPKVFSVGRAPVSAVATDINGDGISDLVVGNRGTTNLSVLISVGDGEFIASRDMDSGIRPEGMVTADFNRDGRPDLAVVNTGSNNVSVFLGDGQGGFQPRRDFSVGGEPRFITSGDFDRDNNIDLAIANFHSHTITLLFGDGQGGFDRRRDLSNPGQFNPTGLVAVNLDETTPTILDLVVPNFSTNTVSLFFGDGRGNFAAPQHLSINGGQGPCSVAVQDFNRDGRPDLLVLNRDSNNLSVFINNGQHVFAQRPTNITVGQFPVSLAAAHIAGGSDWDLVVVNQRSNNVSVLLGAGAGNFTPATGSPFRAGNDPTGLVVRDLNNDGKLDLAVTNASDSNVSILLGDGRGGFSAPVNFGVGATPSFVVVNTFNGDAQRPDLVVSNVNSGGISLLLNRTGL